MDGQEFKARLKALRIKQIDFAAACEVTPATVTLWVKGQTKLPGAAKRYLEALELMHGVYDKARPGTQ